MVDGGRNTLASGADAFPALDPKFTARMCFYGRDPTESLALPLLKGLEKGPQHVPGACPCIPGHNRRGEAPLPCRL